MKLIKHFAYKKIKNPTENYLVIKNNKSKYFSFNSYKTDRSMGQTNIVIGKKLNNILNKYLEFHDSEFLLLNTKHEPLTSNGLCKRLTSIFSSTGKNISVSLLRHSYITHRFPPDNIDRIKVAENMMHSTKMQTMYSKKD